MEVKLSTTLIQPTNSSLNVNLTGTELGTVSTSVLQASDGSSYEQISRTGTALNVNVVNSLGTIKLDTASLDALENITATIAPSSLAALENISIDAGNISVTNFPATQSVTGPLTDAQLRASAVPVRLPNSNTANVSRINAASSTQILAANPNRKGFCIASEGTLYVLYGTGTASSTNYSVRIVANGYYEPPEDMIWQGAIQAQGATVQVTEYL